MRSGIISGSRNARKWAAKGFTYLRDLYVIENQKVTLPDGRTFTFLVGAEKGIDVRLALDVIRLAHQNEYDVALLFSSDQDLSEVAEEIRLIARERRRWIKIASAYPYSPAYKVRGINKTDWIPIDRATYDACLDPRDYRPKRPANPASS